MENAYDVGTKPALVTVIVRTTVLAWLILAPFSCMAASSASSGAFVVQGFIAVLIGIGLGYFIWKNGVANWESRSKTAEEYFQRVSELGTQFANQELNFVPTDITDYYRPKKNEDVLWAGSASMKTIRERTVRVNHSGPRTRIRIAKGFYYTAGSTKITRHKEQYLHDEGSGVLVLTTKRVAFMNSTAGGSNWTKTWGTVASWEAYTDGLEVSPNSGRAKMFLLAGAGRDPVQDPQLVNLIMEVGCDGFPE